ncbi:DUF6286 domain-containing protein [Saccharopolyspora rosea]|uniref:DUF6286 domain-containing protein n=1 Tax=Saccharopolyspora rosea TaxID=524884 RepID=A0ABW3FT32_9PSEU|nr:DUF6286 domain-containing protein [Saccharopolyspora rosea]
MRLLVRLITTLVGLAVAAAGVLLVVETAWAQLRPDTGGLLVPWPTMRSALDAVPWDATPVRATAIGVAVAGLLLLLVAAGARRRDVRLHDPAPEVTVTTDPRSLARLVGHQVRDQDGVASASVTADAKRVRVRATSQFRQLGDLRQRVTDTTEHAVGDLPLRRAPKVAVSVSPAKERR